MAPKTRTKMVDSEVKRTDPADVDKGVKMEAA
jgi:hypothetical protein